MYSLYSTAILLVHSCYILGVPLVYPGTLLAHSCCRLLAHSLNTPAILLVHSCYTPAIHPARFLIYLPLVYPGTLLAHSCCILLVHSLHTPAGLGTLLLHSLLYPWHTPGMTWCTPSTLLLYSWCIPAILLAYPWHTPGTLLLHMAGTLLLHSC